MTFLGYRELKPQGKPPPLNQVRQENPESQLRCVYLGRKPLSLKLAGTLK